MDNIPPTRLQQKISSILDCIVAQTIIVIVVLLDTLIIAILLVIDLCISQDLTNDCASCTAVFLKYERIRQTQYAISIFHLTVLTGFLIEILIRILSNFPAIRHDRWQVFDCVLVMVMFVLFTILLVRVSSRVVAYSVSSFISLRLWRIGRLYYAIKKEALMEADVQIRSLSDYETLLKIAKHKISLQQRQMERLEQAMLFFNSLAQTSANSHTQLIPKLLETEKDSKSSDSSCVNEAYFGESSNSCKLQPFTSASSSYQVSINGTSNPSAKDPSAKYQILNGSSEMSSTVTPNDESRALPLDLLQSTTTSHTQDPFSLDSMRSYVSQDGIPMTDL